MTDSGEGELKKRLKEAFWAKFHKSGELWFDYLGSEEECAEITESSWRDFEERLGFLEDAKKDLQIDEIEKFKTLIDIIKKNIDEKFSKRWAIDVLEEYMEKLAEWFGK